MSFFDFNKVFFKKKINLVFQFYHKYQIRHLINCTSGLNSLNLINTEKAVLTKPNNKKTPIYQTLVKLVQDLNKQLKENIIINLDLTFFIFSKDMVLFR